MHGSLEASKFSEVLKTLINNTIVSSQSADPELGIVLDNEKLQIKLLRTGFVIGSDMLYLSESVLEKKVKRHTHTITNAVAQHEHGAGALTAPNGKVNGETESFPLPTEKGGGACWDTTPDDGSASKVKTVCTSDSVDMKSDDKFWWITKGLEKDDLVVLLKFADGDKYLVLTRVYTHDDAHKLSTQ